MVICNTVKGQEVFSKIRNFLIVKNVSVENIIQPVLIGNFEYNPKRESFLLILIDLVIQSWNVNIYHQTDSIIIVNRWLNL